jgi:hypothetical protein
LLKSFYPFILGTQKILKKFNFGYEFIWPLSNMKILFRKFYKSWYFEATLVAIIIVGVIYLLNMRLANDVLISVYAGISNAFSKLLLSLHELITSDSGKKIVIAVVGAISLIILIIWRIVWRLRSSSMLAGITCPNCDSPLVRVKSRSWQKKIRPILPLRRFYCRNCGWKGFRIKSSDSIPLNIRSSKGTRIHVDKIS